MNTFLFKSCFVTNNFFKHINIIIIEVINDTTTHGVPSTFVVSFLIVFLL